MKTFTLSTNLNSWITITFSVIERRCGSFTSVGWRSHFWKVVVGVAPSNVIPEYFFTLRFWKLCFLSVVGLPSYPRFVVREPVQSSITQSSFTYPFLPLHLMTSCFGF